MITHESEYPLVEAALKSIADWVTNYRTAAGFSNEFGMCGPDEVMRKQLHPARLVRRGHQRLSYWSPWRNVAVPAAVRRSNQQGGRKNGKEGKEERVVTQAHLHNPAHTWSDHRMREHSKKGPGRAFGCVEAK